MRLGARIQRADPRRRGGILILFAVLTFVFLAVAGIVIDVGLANLTQAQMQSAVDSAALEGCRWRNFDEGPASSHLEKRRKAAGIVRLTFDDDLHPSNGGYEADNVATTYTTEDPDDVDARSLSAGPGLRVSGGTGAWAARSTIGHHEESVLARLDDPQLQLNAANNAYGDMVAGKFDSTMPHNESGAYERADFVPAPAGAARFLALSFLVRMRRSGDSNPDDGQLGVSSSLPTLPLMFAMGSTILRDPENDWDPRTDGLTVRATAIASARPAMRVGRPPCDESGALLFDHEPDVPTAQRNSISGLVPFFIYRQHWVNHFRNAVWGAQFGAPPTPGGTPSHPGRVRVEADGRVVLDDPPGTTVGHFMFTAGSGSPCDSEVGWPDVVGREVNPATSSPVRGFNYTRTKPAYIAIVEPIVSPTTGLPVLRVIGYGFAHVWPVGGPANQTTPPFSGTGRFVISPGEVLTHYGVESWVAQDNASAILKSAANESVGAALRVEELNAVLAWSNRLAYGTDTPDPARLHDYTYIQRGTVLAPALTR